MDDSDHMADRGSNRHDARSLVDCNSGVLGMERRIGKKMKEEKKMGFNPYDYAKIKEIECDRCAAPIPMLSQTIKEEVIDSQGGDMVKLLFFQCPRCGEKYEILIEDNQMREMIRKRKKILMEIDIKRYIKAREKSIKKLTQKADKIKAAQERHYAELKEKYLPKIRGEKKENEN